MIEVRLAKDEEVDQLKSLWKTCFGDEDTYINLYFDHKYKPEETAVLLWDGEIVAMATMIPAHIVLESGETSNISMLYAIATHPSFQGKGLSTQIINFCHAHLKDQDKGNSILVPAQESLFDFYSKRGYEDGFYTREVTLTYNEISKITGDYKEKGLIRATTASDYNARRRSRLEGQIYVDYGNEEIRYQKKLCQQYGGDLYAIDIGDTCGCAVVERMSLEKVFIKEMLMPNHMIEEGIRQIVALLPAQEYSLRLPVYLGKHLGGSTRHFGMIKSYSPKDVLPPGEVGYLGIAYD